MDKVIFDVRRKMVLDFIEEKNYKPMKFKELCMVFSVPKREKEEFKEFLDQLIAGGELTMTENGRYKKAEPDTFTGKFCGSTRGFGFVTIEGMEQDVFIPADETKGAFHGDTVLIQLVAPAVPAGGTRAAKRAEGKVLQIVERGFTEVTGIFQKNKNYGFVIPDNQKIGSDIFIPCGKTMRAVNGHRVVVKLTDYGNDHKNPEGTVTEILGHADDPKTDILAVVKAFDLPTEFPEDVKTQLLSVPESVSPEETEGRRDLRDRMTVTIDGEDAKDLDDAITLEMKDGHYFLGVHIADVTHYVKEGSPLDKEALKRGTSVYLVNKVIPMLPHALSNGICSLNEGVDRLALSCLMELDERGGIIGHEITESVIRVNHRMSYNQVSRILDGDKELTVVYADAVKMFKEMKTLSDLLRKKRKERGGIDFDFPESKIELDDRDFPVDIHPYDRNPATKIIEDFMLMANETIAEDFFWQELPFLYRSHESPDTDRIKRLMILIKNYGYYMNIRQDSIHPMEFQKLLGKIEGTPEETMISRLVLRSMKQARYTTENLGHFGLAVSYYCHFTSPIRRYPDLQIHRIIKENLHGQLDDGRQAHYHHILPDVAVQTSSTERRADEAEREVEKMKKAEYMSKRIGQRYEGVVSGITNWGMYVELPNTCEGLIRLQDMDDDYYIFDENTYTLTGEDTGRTFKLGEHVRIIVKDVDFLAKAVNFMLEDSIFAEGEM